MQKTVDLWLTVGLKVCVVGSTRYSNTSSTCDIGIGPLPGVRSRLLLTETLGFRQIGFEIASVGIADPRSVHGHLSEGSVV